MLYIGESPFIYLLIFLGEKVESDKKGVLKIVNFNNIKERYIKFDYFIG